MRLKIGSEPQLFIDDAIIGAKRGVVRTLHPARKLEQPVLRPDRPWEGRRVYIYGSVHYDNDARLFRMWYNTRLGRGQQLRARPVYADGRETSSSMPSLRKASTGRSPV